MLYCGRCRGPVLVYAHVAEGEAWREASCMHCGKVYDSEFIDRRVAAARETRLRAERAHQIRAARPPGTTARAR